MRPQIPCINTIRVIHVFNYTRKGTVKGNKRTTYLGLEREKKIKNKKIVGAIPSQHLLALSGFIEGTTLTNYLKKVNRHCTARGNLHITNSFACRRRGWRGRLVLVRARLTHIVHSRRWRGWWCKLLGHQWLWSIWTCTTTKLLLLWLLWLLLRWLWGLLCLRLACALHIPPTTSISRVGTSVVIRSIIILTSKVVCTIWGSRSSIRWLVVPVLVWLTSHTPIGVAVGTIKCTRVPPIPATIAVSEVAASTSSPSIFSSHSSVALILVHQVRVV